MDLILFRVGLALNQGFTHQNWLALELLDGLGELKVFVGSKLWCFALGDRFARFLFEALKGFLAGLLARPVLLFFTLAAGQVFL